MCRALVCEMQDRHTCETMASEGAFHVISNIPDNTATDDQSIPTGVFTGSCLDQRIGRRRTLWVCVCCPDTATIHHHDRKTGHG